MHNLQPKALNCLLLASMTPGSEERDALYELICGWYSERAVCAKMEELVRRGYLECGVSARTGWLTEKGKAALLEADGHVSHFSGCLPLPPS